MNNALIASIAGHLARPILHIAPLWCDLDALAEAVHGDELATERATLALRWGVAGAPDWHAYRAIEMFAEAIDDARALEVQEGRVASRTVRSARRPLARASRVA